MVFPQADTIWTPSPLTRFRNAATYSSATPCNILAGPGDSITEGQGAGGDGFDVDANNIELNFVGQLTRLLQAHYGAGGIGFVNTYTQLFPGANAALSGASYWIRSANSGTFSIDDPLAFGLRSYQPVANETLTFHYDGTSALIQHRQGDAAAVPFTVTVDGGSPVTVTPATTGGASYQGTYHTPTLTHGSHTAVCAPLTTGTIVRVHGAFVYDGDETSGIHMWQNGRGASNTATWVAQPTCFVSPLSANLCHEPALVIIFHGINDNGNNNLGQHVTPATFQTNITTLITRIKAQCSIIPTFLLLGAYQTTGYGGDITPYNTALAQITAADTDHAAGFFNLQATSFNISGAEGSGDGIHPSTVGHANIAQYLYNYLVLS